MSRRTKENDWSLIEDLFHRALERPEESRPAWLREQTSDPRICAEVESLLASLKTQDETGADPSPATSVPPSALPGDRFGGYELLQLLGRGGMGAVYLARRADGQFEQKVALKVLAAHLAGEEFLRRFQNEQRLLASLNHAHITQLHDSGLSSAGNPYLVMEYVEGETLDRYCDTRKLGVEERLKLFLQVCEAVDYAHRNLIVHRDLKPSNILVNAEGSVKLLDFGTAALIADDATSTVTSSRMLTPRYACPERMRGERAHPSHDIFSLGVILYELLVGAWPFGDPSSMLVELQRATGDSAPTPLTGAITEEAARVRSLPLDRLKRILQGDLSAIALKAIDDLATRRYSTVRELSDDLYSYLEGRPVLARPQTAVYRVRKFVSRNWVPVSAAATLIVGLSAAAVLVLGQVRVAREEAARATRMADFANTLFVAPNAAWYSGSGGKGKETKLVDVLAPASQRMSTELKNDPETEFRLRTTFARTYVSLLMLDQAAEQAERASSLLPLVAGKQREAEVELAIARCEILGRQARWKLAEPACHDAEVQAKRLGVTPNRLLLQAANDWSLVLQQLNQVPASLTAVREAIAAVPDPTPEDLPALLVVRNNLAVAGFRGGDYAGAAKEFRAILAARASLTDSAGESGTVLYNIGLSETYGGDLADAEKDLRRAQAVASASPLGKDPRFAAALPTTLALVLLFEGRVDEARAQLAAVRPLLKALTPGGDTWRQAELADAILSLKAGKTEDAEQRLRGLMKFAERDGDGGTSYAGALIKHWLAETLEAEGRISEAHTEAEDAARTLLALYGNENALVKQARAYLAKLSR